MIESLQLSGVFALLLAAGSVRAVRSAVTSFSTADRQRLDEGTPSERRLAALLVRRHDVDQGLLIAHHGAILGFVIALTKMARDVEAPLWLVLLIACPVLLLLGEILPRAAGRRYRRFLARSTHGLSAWTTLSTPVRVPLVGIARGLGHTIFGTDSSSDDGLDEAEFLMLIDHSARVGALEQSERDFVESVFEFDDVKVGRLMTPRTEMFSLPVDLPWDAVIERTRKAGYSRIPMYETRSDDVIGVLLVKDLLRCTKKTPIRERRKLLLHPSFVPANKSGEDMLRAFMEDKHHMSFVVDEHGTLVGLVTIDDVLEALVGDLEEQPDNKTAPIIRRQPDLATVKASMEITDFTQQTGIAITEGDYHTLGGFVFHLLGKVPEPGDVVETDGYHYRVRKMQGRRIDEVDVGLPSAISNGGNNA